MKLLTSLKRVVKFGWQNFYRDKGLSVVSIFVLVITISLFTFMFLLRGVSDAIIADIEDKADMTIDFEVMVKEEKILEIKDEIAEEFNINGMEYVSREDARVEFIERFGDRPSIMESLEEVGNPFPASINIKAGDPQIYQEVSDFLEETYPELIYAADFHGRRDVIHGIFMVTEEVRNGVLISSIIFGIIAFLLVLNTIKLAIYGMKEEIHVMGLVGSSNMFIQGSFITQGALLGIFSAVVSFVLFLVIAFLIPETYNITFDMNLYRYLLSNIPVVAMVQILLGAGLGIISSFLATMRHLK